MVGLYRVKIYIFGNVNIGLPNCAFVATIQIRVLIDVKLHVFRLVLAIRLEFFLVIVMCLKIKLGFTVELVVFNHFLQVVDLMCFNSL